MLPNLQLWFEQLGLMAWPLTLCSIIMLAISIERSIFIFKARMRKKDQLSVLKARLNEQKQQKKIVRDEMMAIHLGELQQNYYAGLKILRIIGTISPMLGLLGTILGIISAFKAIAAQTGAVSPSLIADGLWEAMLTTAVGLGIALPALLIAHMFRHMGEKDLGYFCIELNKMSLSFEIEAGNKAIQKAEISRAA